jgi:3-oxoadipate enol-lactonase
MVSESFLTVSTEDKGRGNLTTSLLAINGTSLYCEELGHGQPVLFSHGLLYNGSMFESQIAALSSEYRCIAYDHRGHGRSADNLVNSLDIDTLCEDTIALIEQLNLGPVHFCGHSLGGFVGIRLASRRADLVRSLILCNTSADAEPFYKLLSYQVLNLSARLFGSHALVDALMPMIFGRAALANPEKHRLLLRSQLVAANRTSIWRAANGVIYRRSQYDLLQKIQAPTLVLTSKEDRLRTAQESRRLAAALPNAMIACLPSGGHMLPIEEPETINQAIKAFLSTIDSSQPISKDN